MKRSMYLLAILAALAIAGCGAAAPAPQPTATAPAGAGAAPAAADGGLEEQNKALVLRVYSEIWTGEVRVADELFGVYAIHHGATVPNGGDGQLALIKNLQAEIPYAVPTVKHISADGDLVAVHWHASAKPADESSGKAVVDLFRVTGGKIMEHWYGSQDVPATTASGNSLFSDVYQGAVAAPGEEREAANQQMVVAAYKGLFNEGKLELLDQFWDPAYYQHNPQVPNGTAGLKSLLAGMPAGAMSMDFFQTVADGDLVWTFAEIPSGGDAPASLLTDIFRVADGKIVEHWDVLPAMGPPPGE